jgi:hypothetical protein
LSLADRLAFIDGILTPAALTLRHAPIGDASLPADERERRKRRLTKGPSEFRDMRGDLPKTKG